MISSRGAPYWFPFFYSRKQILTGKPYEAQLFQDIMWKIYGPFD